MNVVNTTATILLALGMLVAMTAVAPTAFAEPDPPGDDPECIQVYPWSKYCEEPGGAAGHIAKNPVCNDFYCLG